MSNRSASSSEDKRRLVTPSRSHGIYAQAQEKTKNMQYAIRSGGSRKSKTRSFEEDSESEGHSENVEATSKSPGIKKPGQFRCNGGKESSPAGTGLPVTSVKIETTWIPSNSRSGKDWIRTITIRDLLQQLKRQKVKLLLDLDDESSLTLEEAGDSDNDIDMK